MKIHKDDNIIVLSGKDKGKKGKVAKVFPQSSTVVVEHINIRKKHTKPKKSGEKGQIIQMAMPIDSSNVMIVCSSCKKTTRVGNKILEGGKKKVRICKKCNAEL